VKTLFSVAGVTSEDDGAYVRPIGRLDSGTRTAGPRTTGA
jgi:hypothetical protein